MRIAAGLVGILVGISSLFYIGLFGGILGTATSWLGSGPWSNGDPSVKNLGELISLLSYLSGLLAIVGGIVAFSRTRIGGVILAGSAFSHWYLLGLGVIGKVFVLPIAAAAAVAFLAARSSLQAVPLDSSRKRSNQTSNNGANASSSFDLAKWNALVQYDKDIAAVELRLRPLGQKWLDQLASSYLTLSDKSYLPEIEQKIVAAAKVEAEENEQVRIRLEEMRKASMQAQERRVKARQMQFELWRDRLWGNRKAKIRTVTTGSAALLVIALIVGSIVVPRVVEQRKLARTELFLQAADQSDWARARELVESGVDVNATVSDGDPVLITAIFMGANQGNKAALDLALALIEQGAKTNVRFSQGGRTPLHFASSPQIADLLLEHGADVNAQDFEGATPLHLATNPAVISLLLNHAAVVNAKTKLEATPLFFVVERPSPESIDILIKHGADVNAQSINGRTALHVAIMCCLANVKSLVEHGANVNAMDKRGETPLARYLALAGMHSLVAEPEVIEYLKAHGAT